MAVCCSNASVSWRLRSCNSLNSRTFSMAITAWSAKVFSKRDLLVRERAYFHSTNHNTPIATPSRNNGMARIVRVAEACCDALRFRKFSFDFGLRGHERALSVGRSWLGQVANHDRSVSS